MEVNIRGATNDGGTGRVRCVDDGLEVRSAVAIGATFCATMIAPTDAPNASPSEIWDNAAGAKAIEIYPLTAIDPGESVIVGWSTSSGDTAVEENLALAIAAHGASPPAAVQYPNQRVATTAIPHATIPWDGVTTIKRMACISTDDKAIVYHALITY